MRILLIGATGTLGRAVATALAANADLITASRTGEHPVDLTDPASIAALHERLGVVDAVACTAGVTPFKPLADQRADAEASRLTGLGATITGPLSDDGNHYAVGMRDPAGNEFDIN